MATKKYLELQEFDDSTLTEELKETQTQYQKLKFDHAIKGLDNPLILKDVRRDIARLQTEVRKREVAKMSEADLNKRTKIRRRRRRK